MIRAGSGFTIGPEEAIGLVLYAWKHHLFSMQGSERNLGALGLGIAEGGGIRVLMDPQMGRNSIASLVVAW